jgi:hypothetical protein
VTFEGYMIFRRFLVALLRHPLALLHVLKPVLVAYSREPSHY